MNIMAAIEEASSHSMLQALKEGMSGPLRPQWVQAILFLAAGSLVNFLVPPHEKLIPATPDPSLSYPVGAQEFPEALLFVIAYIVPLVIIFSTARFFDKTDFCITALALTQSICMAMFSTTVAKKVAGRPRPCFYAMCGWAFNSTDAEGGHCTAPRAQQWESRQSFPSGHSSFSMAGLAFLAMYLLEKVDLLQRPPRYLSVLQLQAAQLCALAPFAMALWVAISRTVDYWHHYADIVAGMVLGFAIAWFSFGQRARIRSLLVDGHADISKRDARISCDNPDDPMLPSDSDEIRDMV